MVMAIKYEEGLTRRRRILFYDDAYISQAQAKAYIENKLLPIEDSHTLDIDENQMQFLKNLACEVRLMR